MTIPTSNLVAQRDPKTKGKWRFTCRPVSKEKGDPKVEESFLCGFPRYGGGRALHLVDENADELAPAIDFKDWMSGYNQHANDSTAGMLWNPYAAFCFFFQKYAVVYPWWGDVLPLVVDLERLVPTMEYDLQKIQSEYRSKVRLAAMALLEGLEKGRTPQEATQGSLDEYSCPTTILHHAGILRMVELEECFRKLKIIPSRKKEQNLEPRDIVDFRDIRFAAAIALKRLNVGIDEEQEFLDAAASGDATVVTALLSKVDPNWKKPNQRAVNEANYNSLNGGKSALEFAASNGHVQVVKILLRSERIEVSETHLRCAGGKDIFFLMLDYVMAKVGKSAKSAKSARYMLRRKPLTQLYPGPASVDVVEELLRRGFDPDQSDYHGVTALHDACEKGSIDIVHILLTAGSDPYRQTDKGKTPFYLAVEKGHNIVAESLLRTLKNLDINVTPKERRFRPVGMITLEPALSLLSKRGDFSMVKTLLDYTKYHALSAVGAALCGAMEANHSDIFQLLLGSIQINFPADLGVSILEKVLPPAIGAARRDYVLLLLSHEFANLTCLSASLVAAAEKDNTNMVLFLLEQDKIPATTGCLLPALHRACSCGHLEVVKMLLDWVL